MEDGEERLSRALSQPSGRGGQCPPYMNACFGACVGRALPAAASRNGFKTEHLSRFFHDPLSSILYPRVVH
jgi:hypothetical protein